MFFRVHIAIAALAWPQLALSADQAQCFYPDGSKATADVPCFRSDSLSRVCCSPNQICSTNKLCVNKDASAPAQTFRGSCLDPAFGPSCPTFCTGVNANQQSAVVACGDSKAGTFCCDEGKGADCCATPSKILTLGVGNTFPEGLAASSMVSMGTMLNAPPAKSPQPLISMQTNSIIFFSTQAPMQAQTSGVSPTGPLAQPAVTPLSPSAPTLPTIPFAPVESAKGVEVLKPTSVATPSTDAKASAEAAIIAGAASKAPAISSSPPLSAITIASAAIGGVVIVTLIIVVSVIILRWRAAQKNEERRIQEDSVGNDYNGGIRKSIRDKGLGDEASFASGAQVQDEERGLQISGATRSAKADRAMTEVEIPSGFAMIDRSRESPQTVRSNTVEASKDPFQSELSSPRFSNDERNQERSIEPSAREHYRISEPFSRRITLSPFEDPFNDNKRDSEELDSPTKDYLDARGSEWSVATLTTEHQDALPHVGQSRGVSALDREVDLIRSRFLETSRDANQERERTPSGNSDLRAPPTVQTSNGMRVPAAALERRVSSTSLNTMDSDTFQKLLFDVQSRPF